MVKLGLELADRHLGGRHASHMAMRGALGWKCEGHSFVVGGSPPSGTGVLRGLRQGWSGPWSGGCSQSDLFQGWPEACMPRGISFISYSPIFKKILFFLSFLSF